MKYKIGTKVFCYIGSKPTEVQATIQDDSHLKGFVDMRGKSLVKFDKLVRLGDRTITSKTLPNSMISKVKITV